MASTLSIKGSRKLEGMTVLLGAHAYDITEATGQLMDDFAKGDFQLPDDEAHAQRPGGGVRGCHERGDDVGPRGREPLAPSGTERTRRREWCRNMEGR